MIQKLKPATLRNPCLKGLKLILAFLFITLSTTAVSQKPSGFSGRDSDSIKYANPPVYLGEPLSNAGTSLLNDLDGSIKFIYRQGDWDHGGFSDKVYYIST